MRWLTTTLLMLLICDTASEKKIDFVKQVRPILDSRCKPCHFAGGKMYSKLPFDQASTIVRLGEKLFTRIKDDESRAVIRNFLARQNTR